MGVYNGAEVCELVGNYVLYELSNLFEKKDIWLYRDNRLAVFKNKSGPESEKIKKSIQTIFWENELKITIQHNLKIVDYLDVTFSIIKQLLFSVERRLSKLSSHEKIFNDSIPTYHAVLIKRDYNHNHIPKKRPEKRQFTPAQETTPV